MASRCLGGPVLLAFDDTDSPEGGCTTHAVFRVLLAMPGVALGGMPRLVRLNPNWPQKTRGNGAVALPLVEPSGPQVQVGELMGHELRAFPDGRPLKAAELHDAGLLGAAWDALREQAMPGARPGMVACDEPPHASAYALGVTTYLSPEDATSALGDGLRFSGEQADGGWVGATAAAAWPGPPSSFEFLAYRQERGTRRRIGTTGLAALDASGATFHSHDPVSERSACIPQTPCPVLCGLRGRDPERLRSAAAGYMRSQAQEPIQGWLLWATNQASGDHITPVGSVADAPTFATLRVAGTVQEVPERGPGGHVRVRLEDGAGLAFTAMAFEPTHAFRDLVQRLAPGDAVTCTGQWSEGTLGLERIDVTGLALRVDRVAPKCACGRGMRSRGVGQGFKCPGCGQRADEKDGRHERTPALDAGTYEVPVLARRHLHRPAAWD